VRQFKVTTSVHCLKYLLDSTHSFAKGMLLWGGGGGRNFQSTKSMGPVGLPPDDPKHSAGPSTKAEKPRRGELGKSTESREFVGRGRGNRGPERETGYHSDRVGGCNKVQATDWITKLTTTFKNSKEKNRRKR